MWCASCADFADNGLTWEQKIAWKNCTPAMGQGGCLGAELVEVNYKQPPYATRYPKIVDIFEYHPGTPVGCLFADNRYCHTRSPSNVAFMNVRPDEVRGWLSTISNNLEQCP